MILEDHHGMMLKHSDDHHAFLLPDRRDRSIAGCSIADHAIACRPTVCYSTVFKVTLKVLATIE